MAPGRRWCLLGSRAARGLSDPSHRSKLERRGDASVAWQGHRLHNHIFGRISWVVVLFAFHCLRRVTFFQNWDLVRVFNGNAILENGVGMSEIGAKPDQGNSAESSGISSVTALTTRGTPRAVRVGSGCPPGSSPPFVSVRGAATRP